MLHLEGAAAAAAVDRARHLDIFHAGNRFENVPRLGRDLHPFRHMARVVVGHADLLSVFAHFGKPVFVGFDEYRYFHRLGGKQLGRLDLLVRHLLAKLAQILQQMGILVLQRRAAGGTIHQYGIHITARKQLQGLFDDGHRCFPVSRQKDRKAAASLVLGNDDLDAHLGEHVDHRIADVAEDEVRGAAVEIENLRPRLP